MIQKTRRMMGQAKGEKGFTLVEMALVLIIIGIIIGAIVKGSDLVRGAEQKRIYTKFLGDWRLAYMNFYDRTGLILGDTWDLNAAPAAAGQDGQADTAGGDASAPDAPAELATSLIPASYLGLTQVGLQPPTTNVPGMPHQYRYVDSQGNSHLLDIAFEWDAVNNYNYLMINNIPNELAMAIDTMIDGAADGTAGDFRTATGIAWGTVPTADQTDARWRMQF
jgi:prepilin-type N-terminal cleavage/methylation domain-containing protein